MDNNFFNRDIIGLLWYPMFNNSKIKLNWLKIKGLFLRLISDKQIVNPPMRIVFMNTKKWSRKSMTPELVTQSALNIILRPKMVTWVWHKILEINYLVKTQLGTQAHFSKTKWLSQAPKRTSSLFTIQRWT